MKPSERARFADAYDENVWRIYGFFGYRVTSRAEAEDLTQQTFERALRAWNRFDPGKASVATWLMVIARNLLVDHYRQDRSRLRERVEDADARGELRVDVHVDERLGLAPELAAAVAQLGQRQQELIALRFGGDLTGPEIAALTGLTLANVQQILSRTLRQLRALLDVGGPRPG